MHVRRALAKALTYRVLGSIFTLLVARQIFDAWRPAITLALIDPVARFVIYVLHELVWEKISESQARKTKE